MPPMEGVAPHAGAWIETFQSAYQTNTDAVAPHAGAWIETRIPLSRLPQLTSHPTRVRGLKQAEDIAINPVLEGAPHAGAWIETALSIGSKDNQAVAPHAGAWIETRNGGSSVERRSVAPHAGAWIETYALSET